MVPILHYDSSHSAIFRIFGKIAKITFHCPTTGETIERNRLVCPKSISSDKYCKICDGFTEDTVWSFSANIINGWDCQKERWCHGVFSTELIQTFIQSMKENNIDIKLIESGNGPDIIFQRVQNNFDFEFSYETIGEKRGPKPPIRKGQENCPDINSVLQQLNKSSIWKGKNKK